MYLERRKGKGEEICKEDEERERKLEKESDITGQGNQGKWEGKGNSERKTDTMRGERKGMRKGKGKGSGGATRKGNGKWEINEQGESEGGG